MKSTPRVFLIFFDRKDWQMAKSIIGVSTIELHLPGVHSLKEKRSIIKSMTVRLHNTFNVSAAEVDYQDKWQSAVIAIAVVGNSTIYVGQVIHNAINWIESRYPDVQITRQDTEIL